MAHKHYKLEDVVCTVAGIPVLEFAKGDAITVSYSDDDFKVVEGTHGSTCRSGIPNVVGTATLTVMQSSPINELLNDLHHLDKRLGTGVGAFSVLDANGSSLAIAERCWIKKAPDMKFALESSSVAWVFDLVGLDVSHGSNRDV